MFSYNDKKIGIWGFGLVGKSALRYFHERGAMCTILDQRTLNPDELHLTDQYNASIWSGDIPSFLAAQDQVLASPGVDIAAYYDQGKFICELDLFAQEWHKCTLAITGSIGKTSLTTLLHHLINKQMPALMAGNIGIPMLDSLHEQSHVDWTVLELSSWQLEHSRSFAPDIALWTNLYPNHLDRHKTMAAYFHAKAHLLLHQREDQIAILPLALIHQIRELPIKASSVWVHAQKPDRQYLDDNLTIIYLDQDQIILHKDGQSGLLFKTDTLSACTFIENWLFAIATLYSLDVPLTLAHDTSIQLEHRLEKVRTINHLTFYNDSKGTTIEATLAALRQFKQEKVILFLGGTSKGVDRSTLIKQLDHTVVHTICFGKEAQALKNICDQERVSATACNNLNEALTSCLAHQKGATIALFSPSGASFDLYANYQERGNHFKQLVQAL